MKQALWVIFTLFLGCSSSQITRVTKDQYPAIPKTDQIFVITSFEEPPPNSIELGDFQLKEGMFGSGLWQQIKPKVIEIARSNGANIVRVFQYSMSGMVYAGSVSGKLYRLENGLKDYLDAPSAKLTSCGCALVHVLRYEGNLSLRSAFPMKLFMNGIFIDDLASTSEKIVEVNKSGQVIISPYPDGGGVSLNIEIGKEYYVFATQDMSSGSRPGAVGVTIGPKKFEILDSEEGRFRAFLINKQ